MKRNNLHTRYASISNLTELQYEKQLLHYKIAHKEKRIKKDWNTIYDRWHFIPIAANALHSVISYVPVGISVVSKIINSFNRGK
jgi:hypothetical protein